MSDPDLDAPVADLHDHLSATAELPMDREASRWLGEAEAVAADVDDADVPEAVVVERVRRVRELLEQVDTTGNADADEHVDAARDLADAIVKRSGPGEG